MKISLKTGLSFGLTSGIITTLGLIVGLNAGTHSKIVVIGGILTIAITDAFSDALGIHVSQESQNKHSGKSIWESTLATFLSKLLFALTFIATILLFELSTAILISVVWGFLVLSIYNFVVARLQKKNPWKPVTEHFVIGVIVVTVTHFVGGWIADIFN